MFKKLKNVYKREGNFFLFILALVNFVLIRSIGLMISRPYIIGANKTAKNIFKNRSLKDSGKGYLYVDPMPSETELNVYYSNVYWNSRFGKNMGVRLRDLVHWNILNTRIPDFFTNKNKLIVNFGAGHGGISHLFWLNGFNVINIEPSQLPLSYESRWESYQNISKVKDKSVDLIYGSHSLEHVQDIDNFQKEINRILSPNAYLFFEVPNAKFPLDGAMNNRIDIPHTYYFSTDFFDRWFKKVILNKAYFQSHEQGIIEKWHEYEDCNGPVIRVIGKI